MPDTNVNVIEMPKPAPESPSTSGTGGYGTKRAATTAARIGEPIVRGTTVLKPIEIDKLYPADKNNRSDVLAALPQLADAIDLLEKARAALRTEAATADRYWQHFQMLLPDLFKYRKIGDGYGVVINALHFASINLHGAPLSFEQLTTVWRVVKELRSAPFTPFEQALKYVQELEDCDLQVYPATISELIEEESEVINEEPEDE
jgi:hypothetical protein